MMQTIVEMKESNESNHINDPYLAEVFKPENRYKSSLMLTIKEFIEISKFPIDSFMVDNFFNNLNDDIPVYVNNELIEWCGFGSKDISNKRLEFNRILKQFERNKDYWLYSNLEYQDYYKSIFQSGKIGNVEKGDIGKSINYPNPTTFAGKNKTKHIILTTNCFKMVLMMLNTKKASIIRQHFLTMEKVLLLYWKYQCEFYKRSLDIELKEISNLPHNKEYNTLIKFQTLNGEIEAKQKVGVIYFIHEEDNQDIIKIGYTFHLRTRLEQLQTAHYKKLVVKHYYFTQYPYEEEQLLHEKYKDRRIRGEWFRLEKIELF